jgi:hypothetical protein
MIELSATCLQEDLAFVTTNVADLPAHGSLVFRWHSLVFQPPSRTGRGRDLTNRSREARAQRLRKTV